MAFGPFPTKAKFLGVSACQNPNYFRALWAIPEQFRGVSLDFSQMPKNNVAELCDSSEAAKYGHLKSGETYTILFTIAVNVGGNRNGKEYKPSLEFKIAEIKAPVESR